MEYQERNKAVLTIVQREVLHVLRYFKSVDAVIGTKLNDIIDKVRPLMRNQECITDLEGTVRRSLEKFCEMKFVKNYKRTGRYLLVDEKGASKYCGLVPNAREPAKKQLKKNKAQKEKQSTKLCPDPVVESNDCFVNQIMGCFAKSQSGNPPLPDGLCELNAQEGNEKTYFGNAAEKPLPGDAQHDPNGSKFSGNSSGKTPPGKTKKRRPSSEMLGNVTPKRRAVDPFTAAPIKHAGLQDCINDLQSPIQAQPRESVALRDEKLLPASKFNLKKLDNFFVDGNGNLVFKEDMSCLTIIPHHDPTVRNAQCEINLPELEEEGVVNRLSEPVRIKDKKAT